jgi:DNA modification methylase
MKTYPKFAPSTAEALTEEAYEQFLRAKVPGSSECGFDVAESDIHPMLKPHQKAAVRWAVRHGRAAIFEAFGLGKTFQQLEICRLILHAVSASRKQEELFPYCRALIVAPLGVRQEFERDARKLGQQITFIRRIEEAEPTGLYLTNYESIRDGKLDPKLFTVVSLDEAGILRGFGGTKTFREFMRHFEGSGIYRFVATATPSPNEYIELLAYAAFLGVMDVGQAKTRFFKRDSTKADKLTLHPHKEREFWLWVSTWALFLQKPSDLGFSDEGYTLPPIEIHWHEVPSDYADAGEEVSGQGRLVRDVAIGVTHAAREKRDSLSARIEKLMEIRAINPNAHRIIWHDLESERHAIEKAIPTVTSVYGAQRSKPNGDEQIAAILAQFADGEIQELAGKPSMLGTGGNYQRHCHWSIFLGIGFKFHEFIQAVHRVQRFLQEHTVRLDLIYTEAERPIRQELERKWEQHKTLVANMSAIIQQYGLATAAIESELRRQFGVPRREESGEMFRLVNNDSIYEGHGWKGAPEMESNSVHLILTSIPFSTQYEYTPSYHDFGHSDDNGHFFRQMNFLTPELLRILKPGRNFMCHVKDRIVPGGMTGLGFQTVYPFHADCIQHYTKHGFAYLGMKTIVTDVVRENNQTYRMGWTEQCKDGTRMGVGMPEYLLLFRKPPTDASNGYADDPVIKEKPDCICSDHVFEGGDFVAEYGVCITCGAAPGSGPTVIPFNPDLPIKPGTGYSRSRWQLDAHGYARSSGNRLLSLQDMRKLKHEQIYKMFRAQSLTTLYNFEQHVDTAEMLEGDMRLPVTFMLLPPQSWHPDVWTDITRMLTLNGAQSAKGREMHLCPMQFDLADRIIRQFTQPGEIVWDPFMGIGTVPSRAVKAKRIGWGCELSHGYYLDALLYCRAEEAKASMPTLFDLWEEENGSPIDVPFEVLE